MIQRSSWNYYEKIFWFNIFELIVVIEEVKLKEGGRTKKNVGEGEIIRRNEVEWCKKKFSIKKGGL